MQKEGYDVAQWLAGHGIAAFVLKNRLAKDDATPAQKAAFEAWLEEPFDGTKPAA